VWSSPPLINICEASLQCQYFDDPAISNKMNIYGKYKTNEGNNQPVGLSYQPSYFRPTMLLLKAYSCAGCLLVSGRSSPGPGTIVRIWERSVMLSRTGNVSMPPSLTLYGRLRCYYPLAEPRPRRRPDPPSRRRDRNMSAGSSAPSRARRSGGLPPHGPES